MGRRGPPPKPTAIKLLEGNPGKRRINTREPKPSNKIPRCPDRLDEDARAYWKLLIADLKHMGVLTHADYAAICGYCDVWSRWKRAIRFVQENGDVYTAKDDAGKVRYVAQWPQVGIANQLLAAMHRYQQDFGLTPSARSRLTFRDEKPSSGIMEFLGLSNAVRLAQAPLHGGNPVLRAHAQATTVKLYVNENLRPVKDRNTGRIDGIVALIMAISRAVKHDQHVSKYNSVRVTVIRW